MPLQGPGCSSVVGIKIPDSVTHMGNGVFEHCSSLTGITIPDSVTQFGHGAFEQCRYLQSIHIPPSVTEIGVGAFLCCSSLRNITIPDSVSCIMDKAFEGCSSLECGQGLNLQEACSMVVFAELFWTPGVLILYRQRIEPIAWGNRSVSRSITLSPKEQ